MEILTCQEMIMDVGHVSQGNVPESVSIKDQICISYYQLMRDTESSGAQCKKTSNYTLQKTGL